METKNLPYYKFRQTNQTYIDLQLFLAKKVIKWAKTKLRSVSNIQLVFQLFCQNLEISVEGFELNIERAIIDSKFRSAGVYRSFASFPCRLAKNTKTGQPTRAYNKGSFFGYAK